VDKVTKILIMTIAALSIIATTNIHRLEPSTGTAIMRAIIGGAGVVIFFIMWAYILKLHKHLLGKITIALILVGFLLNHTVIIANGGFMPVEATYYYTITQAEQHEYWTALTETHRLPFLADVLLGRMSIGDVMLLCGGTIFLIHWFAQIPKRKKGESLKD